jgi:hypothetical protein
MKIKHIIAAGLLIAATLQACKTGQQKEEVSGSAKLFSLLPEYCNTPRCHGI